MKKPDEKPNRQFEETPPEEGGFDVGWPGEEQPVEEPFEEKWAEEGRLDADWPEEKPPGEEPLGEEWMVERQPGEEPFEEEWPEEEALDEEWPDEEWLEEEDFDEEPPDEEQGAYRVKKIVIAVLALVCSVVLVVSVVQIISIQAGRNAARREYDALQSQFAPGPQTASASGSEADETEPPRPPGEINPDYVGWLSVPGAGIEYPVVRGQDNVKYLDTTFEGARNAVGTIFMDYENTDDFASQHAVLYGHNVKNGMMFGRLKQYLDADYLAANPSVIVTLPDGTTYQYQIFSAYVTDGWDPAYQHSFAGEAEFAAFAAGLGAPQGTLRLLTFSTCTNGEDDNERILVHAAHVPG